jgi:hypothetical protein
VFRAEQSAIIEAIQSEKNNRHEIVIITDSLSTLMVAENRTPSKNPKTQTTRKMLEHEGPRINLLWIPSHVGIPGNEKANQAAKEALDKDISTTKRYPPDDLKKCLTEEDFRKRDQRWKNGNNEMKERKLDFDRKEDTKGMSRKEQVAISRLRTGYTRAPHGPKMEGVSNPLCQDQRMNMDMRKKQWINGKKGMEKIIDYAKEIGLYNGI